MQTESMTFQSRNGEPLSARLELPEGEQRYGAIFAHCFTCSKDIAAATRISRSLSRQGVAVLRFDFTGLGQSEGEFSDTNFTSNVDDLLAAEECMRDIRKIPVRLLIGHSLGGAAVLAAAAQIKDVEAVATIGAPCDPAHVIENFKADIKKIESDGFANVTLGHRTLKIKKQFLDDLENQDSRQTLKELRKALLIFHSPQDQIVGIENAQEIYLNSHHPKSFISLDGADHLLTNKKDSEYVGNVLAAWADRYIC